MILASDPGLNYDEIGYYFKFANKSHRFDGTMKKIIHYQYYCVNKIDDDKNKYEIFDGQIGLQQKLKRICFHQFKLFSYRFLHRKGIILCFLCAA